MKTNWFSITLMTALLVLGTTALVSAGDEEGETTSLTGCLAETDDGGYILTEEVSGDEVTLQGDGLGDHVGHTVEVSGDWAEDDDGNEYFAVESLEHLAASCE